MSDVPVTLRIPVDQDWSSDDELQVFTDFGTGSMDLTEPLLARQAAMFPGAFESIGYGEGVYGTESYGLSTPRAAVGGGFGDDDYGERPYGESRQYVEATVRVPQAFGNHKFAARAVDGAGNEQTAGLIEFTELVSGETPDGLKRFAFSSYDGVVDAVHFTFEL